MCVCGTRSLSNFRFCCRSVSAVLTISTKYITNIIKYTHTHFVHALQNVESVYLLAVSRSTRIVLQKPLIPFRSLQFAHEQLDTCFVRCCFEALDDNTLRIACSTFPQSTLSCHFAIEFKQNRRMLRLNCESLSSSSFRVLELKEQRAAKKDKCKEEIT